MRSGRRERACYGATIHTVRSINRQIRSLARVLNAPFVTSRHKARDTMAGKVRYMVKWAKGKFWVFAGADRGGGTATFSMRCVGNATAKVLFENRSIPVRRGLVQGLLRGQERGPHIPHRRRLELWADLACEGS